MVLYADILLLADGTLRTSTPLIFAALAGLISERSGVVDISLEGKMLMAAFSAGAAASLTSSPWIGMLAGVLISLMMGLLHGYVSIHQRGNQIVSSMAINIIAAGLAPSLAIYVFHRGGQTPFLQDSERFGEITLPLVDAVKDIPFLGSFYGEVVSGHSLLTYLAFGAVLITIWLLYRTRLGLRIRAVGENPAAVDTAGLSVYAIRYYAVALSSIICGLGGVFLSLGSGAPNFIPNMTAGRGYLALAAMICGRWKPVPTLIACLLFGFFDAVQGRLQGVKIFFMGVLPIQFTQLLPYGLTVLVLALFAGRMTPPKASGHPYHRER